MHEITEEILLVTPVWNDSARLARFGPGLAAALAACPLPIRWMIADDGSEPGDRERLKKLVADFSRIHPRTDLHLASAHRGKGAVVREAWSLDPAAVWLAFVDADGAVPAAEMLRLIDIAVNSHRSVFGIRKRTAETRIEESFRRSLSHHAFIAAARMVLRIPSEDPQCGAKVLRGDDYRAVAGSLREEGFAFDCELLARLQRAGSTWLEVPVNWTEIKGGKVRFPRDALRMLRALFRIRGRIG